jgi:hypothetical protein
VLKRKSSRKKKKKNRSRNKRLSKKKEEEVEVKNKRNKKKWKLFKNRMTLLLRKKEKRITKKIRLKIIQALIKVPHKIYNRQQMLQVRSNKIKEAENQPYKMTQNNKTKIQISLLQSLHPKINHPLPPHLESIMQTSIKSLRN